jgi:hypothetical protein
VGFHISRMRLTDEGRPRRGTTAGGGCRGGGGGSVEAAARVDGEVPGADGELVVALVARMGTRRGPAPVECL